MQASLLHSKNFGNVLSFSSRRIPLRSPSRMISIPVEPSVSQERGVASAASTSGASTHPSFEMLSTSPNSSSPQGPQWLKNTIIWWNANRRTIALISCSLALWTMFSSTNPGGPFASVSMAHSPAEKGLSATVKSAWAGLAAGFLHTLAGPDHLAALTPLTIGRTRLKAAVLGALWGWGHSVGQLILGLLMVLLKDQFNGLLPALSKWGGTLIGLSLIGIGCLGIYECFFEKEDEHDKHRQQTVEEMQPALAAVGEATATGAVKKEKAGFGFATFATGILYGLNPDTLFIILPALALPTKLAAFAYISMFVVGTVLAMSGYTFAIGATTEKLGQKVPKATTSLSVAASAVALVFGALFVLTNALGFDLPFGLEL